MLTVASHRCLSYRLLFLWPGTIFLYVMFTVIRCLLMPTFTATFLKTLWKQAWSTALTVICHHTTPDVILDVTDHCCCLTENRSGVWTRTCTRPRMTTNTGCTGGTCTPLRRQVSLERSMSSSMLGGDLICLNWMETNNQNTQDGQTAFNGILHVFTCQRSHSGNHFFSLWLELSLNWCLQPVFLISRVSEDLGIPLLYICTLKDCAKSVHTWNVKSAYLCWCTTVAFNSIKPNPILNPIAPFHSKYWTTHRGFSNI